LTKAEYEKIRKRDAAKKEENYKKNLSKAFKFLDFTQFYLKRGTDEGGSWIKAPARGHTLVKTKYDFSGGKDDQKIYDGAKGSIFGK